MKTIASRINQLLLAASISALWNPAIGHAFEATGGGNGGQILRSYLNTTREKLVEVLNKVRTNGLEHYQVCEQHQGISPEQEAFCKQFAPIYLEQVLAMNNPFVSSFELGGNDTVYVMDPQNQRVVANAVTDHPRTAPIIFNQDIVRLYSPRDMLFLELHEFGHKVLFQEGYVKDYDAFGVFDRGDKLLDLLAEDLADVALNEGIIGSAFSLIDQFSCTMEVTGLPTPMTVFWQSPRQFIMPNGIVNLDHYMAGFGIPGPSQYSLTFRDPYSQQERFLYLQFWVYTIFGCAEDEGHPVASYLKLTPTSGPDTDNIRVTQKKNMMCHMNEPMVLTYRDYKFTCRYTGSYTITNTVNVH